MSALIKKTLLVCGTIAGAFALGFGYSYWQAKPADIHFEHCSALQQGRCSWFVEQQQWQLTLPSDSLPAMLAQPLRLSTNLENPPPLELSLQGIDMYMGEVKVNLQPNANGSYQSELLLPICNTGKMRWRAEITSLDASRPLALSFEVDSQ